MRARTRRGQSWSMDLVIAVVVFGFIAVIFYSLLVIQQRPSIDQLQSRAQTVESKLRSNSGPCGAIIANQTITQSQLQCLYNQNDSTLHDLFGIPGNFCIYVEDANGTIYVVQNGSGAVRTGVGDSALVVAGTPCGTATP